MPELRSVSDSACKTYGIKKHRIKCNIYGRKMLDGKKLYRLRKEGKLIQPFITASEAIERVYDPYSPICMACDKRCKRGKGIIKERSIKRLIGEPIKR